MISYRGLLFICYQALRTRYFWTIFFIFEYSSWYLLSFFANSIFDLHWFYCCKIFFITNLSIDVSFFYLYTLYISYFLFSMGYFWIYSIFSYLSIFVIPYLLYSSIFSGDPAIVEKELFFRSFGELDADSLLFSRGICFIFKRFDKFCFFWILFFYFSISSGKTNSLSIKKSISSWNVGNPSSDYFYNSIYLTKCCKLAQTTF